MLLSLLIYSYATGTFGSSRIEPPIYDIVALWFIRADTRPNHDTICTFRQENKALLSKAFVKVLEMARELKGLKVGQRDLANRQGIELVQEHQIVSMLQGSDARFDPEIIELLDYTRKFCPKCEAEMVLRTAAKGTNVGKTFWGCSRYPRCRYVLHTGDEALT